MGGLDLEATLASGARVLRRGALERAHGGALVLESLNLLPEAITNPLLAVLDEGRLRIEREGISRLADCRFVTLAGYDPAEGVPRSHFIDRLGLIVQLPKLSAANVRTTIIGRHLGNADPAWPEELEILRELVAAARDSLPQIVISARQIGELVTAAEAFGVQGHRADFLAVLTARASAALALRDRVESEDLETALRFVLAPRATRMPQSAQPPRRSLHRRRARTRNKALMMQNRNWRPPTRSNLNSARKCSKPLRPSCRACSTRCRLPVPVTAPQVRAAAPAVDAADILPASRAARVQAESMCSPRCASLLVGKSYARDALG